MEILQGEGLEDLVLYGDVTACIDNTIPSESHMTRSPRPSPAVFAYCKGSKTGRWEWPGNDASGFRASQLAERGSPHTAIDW